MAICIYHSFVQLPVLQRKSLGKNKCPYKGGPTSCIFLLLYGNGTIYVHNNFSCVIVYIYLFILENFLVHISPFDQLRLTCFGP